MQPRNPDLHAVRKIETLISRQVLLFNDLAERFLIFNHLKKAHIGGGTDFDTTPALSIE